MRVIVQCKHVVWRTKIAGLEESEQLHMKQYVSIYYFFCSNSILWTLSVFLFKVMQDAMGTATTTTTPQNQVEDLMKQVAEENGLEIAEQLASVPSATVGEATAASATTSQDDALGRRLAALRS